MPKSCSLRASMPIRTAGSYRQDGQDRQPLPPLAVPPVVVEPIAPQDVAARAGVDVSLAGGFVCAEDGRVDVVRHAADVGERRFATGRDRSLHRARIPQREPFVTEGADDATLIANALEAQPAAVECVGF